MFTDSGWVLTECTSPVKYTAAMPNAAYFHFTRDPGTSQGESNFPVLGEYSGYVSHISGGSHLSIMRFAALQHGSCKEPNQAPNSVAPNYGAPVS
jgi:hypothetical protein